MNKNRIDKKENRYVKLFAGLLLAAGVLSGCGKEAAEEAETGSNESSVLSMENEGFDYFSASWKTEEEIAEDEERWSLAEVVSCSAWQGETWDVQDIVPLMGLEGTSGSIIRKRLKRRKTFRELG